MALLIHATAKTVQRGEYSVVVVIGTGTALLSFSQDGQTAVAITDASWSASATAVLTIGDGVITPTLTGDAVVSLEKLTYSPR
jgi:hypothetical protein